MRNSNLFTAIVILLAAPHLAVAAQDRSRPLDLSDVDVVGQKIEDVASYHDFAIPYDDEKKLPLKFAEKGIKGLTLGNVDLSVCTYCTEVLPLVIPYLYMAWKGEPWPDVEVLTGKKAGKRGRDGSYPKDTIYGLVDARLRELAEEVRRFGSAGCGSGGFSIGSPVILTRPCRCEQKPLKPRYPSWYESSTTSIACSRATIDRTQ